VPSISPTAIIAGHDPSASQPIDSGIRRNVSIAPPTRRAPMRSLSKPSGTRSSAQQGAAQDRQRDEHAALARSQTEVLGDQDAERADQHPQHEAQIEVQEAGNQRRQVATPGDASPG
jgi:hypothetical protein